MENPRQLITQTDFVAEGRTLSTIASSFVRREEESPLTIFIPSVPTAERETFDIGEQLKLAREAFDCKNTITYPKLSPVRKEMMTATSELIQEAENAEIFFTPAQLGFIIEKFDNLAAAVNKRLDIIALYELQLVMQLSLLRACDRVQTNTNVTAPSTIEETQYDRIIPRATHYLNTLEETPIVNSSRLPVPRLDLQGIEISLKRLRVFLAAAPQIAWSEVLLRFLEMHLELLNSTDMASIKNINDLENFLRDSIGFDTEGVKLTRFREITQNYNELPGALWMRVKSSYASVFPGNRNSPGDQSILKERFFDALRDQDLAHALRMENPDTKVLITRCVAIKTALDRRANAEQLNRITEESTDNYNDEEDDNSDWSDDNEEDYWSETERSSSQEDQNDEDTYEDSESEINENADEELGQDEEWADDYESVNATTTTNKSVIDKAYEQFFD